MSFLRRRTSAGGCPLIRVYKRALRGSLELLFGGIVQLESSSRNKESFILSCADHTASQIHLPECAFFRLVAVLFLIDKQQPRSAPLRSSRACRSDVEGGECLSRGGELSAALFSLSKNVRHGVRCSAAFPWISQKFFFYCLGIYRLFVGR